MRQHIVATKNTALPIGTILYLHEVPYNDFLICDGRMLRVHEHPELFGVVGYAYTFTSAEVWWKRWLRQVFNLPGPNSAILPGEFRIPNLVG